MILHSYQDPNVVVSISHRTPMQAQEVVRDSRLELKLMVRRLKGVYRLNIFLENPIADFSRSV